MNKLNPVAVSLIAFALLIHSSPAFAKSPRLGICSKAILAEVSKTYPGFSLEINDPSGKLLRGFESGRYKEGGPLKLSTVLIIPNKTYYYFEPCDICASLWVCEWTSSKGLGLAYEVKNEHALGCEDLPQVDPREIRYTACQE